MRFPAAALLCLLAGAAAADAPTGLTAHRTAQGIFLIWSGTATGRFGVWRGADGAHLNRLAVLDPTQSGFLDLNAAPGQGYAYALGSETAPGAAITVPGPAAPAGPVRVLPALVTVCSGLAPGGKFPANTRNTFTASRDANVQFYGYFLVKPWNPSPRTAKLVWRDPQGAVFSEYSHSITPREVTLPDGPGGNLLLAQAIGLRQVVAENGQTRVPNASGLYTVAAYLDDVQISESVFYLQEEAKPK